MFNFNDRFLVFFFYFYKLYKLDIINELIENKRIPVFIIIIVIIIVITVMVKISLYRNGVNVIVYSKYGSRKTLIKKFRRNNNSRMYCLVK